MEPRISRGAAVFVEPVDPAVVRSGSVISFDDPADRSRVVVHRVVRVRETERGVFFETQGDANAAPDGHAVPARGVRGRVRWSVVGLGSLVSWLGQGNVGLGLLTLPLGALALSELGGMRERRRARRERAEIERLTAEIERLEAALAAALRSAPASRTRWALRVLPWLGGGGGRESNPPVRDRLTHPL